MDKKVIYEEVKVNLLKEGIDEDAKYTLTFEGYCIFISIALIFLVLAIIAFGGII